MMHKRKHRTGVLVLALCLILLAGCSPAEEVIFYEDVESNTGLFTVTIPSNWSSAEGQLNDQAELELAREGETHFIMALSTPAMDYNGTLDEYAVDAKANIESVYSTQLPTGEEDWLGSYPAYRFEFETAVNKLNIYFRVYVLRTENYFVDLYTWSVTSLKDQEQDVIRTILNSFHETDLPETRTLANSTDELGFSAVPRGWIQMEEETHEGTVDLQIASMDGKKFLAVSAMKKAIANSDYQLFSGAMVQAMEKTYSIQLAGTQKTVDLSGGTAEVYEFESTETDSTVIHYWMYVLETDTYFNVVLGAVAKEDLSAFRTEVETVAASFNEF